MNCTHEHCIKEVRTAGYCNSHYLRLRRYGSSYGGKKIKSISCKHLSYEGVKYNWSHPLYNTYVGLFDRCYNPKNVKFHLYGLRGIKVSDLWLGECGFHNFVESLGNKPYPSSLDRIDLNGDYSPNNCRWATIHEQNSNKRNNRKHVGVYKANDNRKHKWRTSLVIKGREVAGKSFITELEAVYYINKLKKEKGIYVG